MNDRELDALVAVSVMGWVRTAGGWTNNDTRQWSVDVGQIPHYSTNIKTAFLMEERVLTSRHGSDYGRSLMKVVGRKRLPMENADRCAECERLYPMEEYRADIIAIAHATPHQRCLAALMTVGVEVPA